MIEIIKAGQLSSSLRLPAEWEPHAATWIAWPQNKSDWPGKFASIKWVYAEIVKYLSRGEKVRIFVQSNNEKLKAEYPSRTPSNTLAFSSSFIWSPIK